MNKQTLLALLFSGVLCTPVWATSVGFSASPASRTVVTSTGATIANGSLVWEGVFSSTGSFAYNPSLSIAANVANIESANGWTQFSLSAGTTTTLGITSNFGVTQVSGSVTDNSAGANSFNGQQVFLWVFNGTTVGTSTQMGIFTNSGWTFPTNAGGVGDTSTYATDTTDTPTVVSEVGTSTNSGGPNGNGTLALAASVPEPSTLAALFGATGLLAMLRRRRSE